MKPDIKFLISIPVHGNPQICAFYTTEPGVHDYYMQDPEGTVECELPFWINDLTEPGLYVVDCDMDMDYDPVSLSAKEKRAYNPEEDFKLFFTPLEQRTTLEDILYRFCLDAEELEEEEGKTELLKKYSLSWPEYEQELISKLKDINDVHYFSMWDDALMDDSVLT